MIFVPQGPAITLTAAEWHSVPGARWSALEDPGNGKTGFRPLTTTETSITFTNRLDEWTSAANRTLQNGSGVACGDYDRDGKPDIFLCSLTGQNALYRNLGGFRFQDSTVSAGLTLTNMSCRGAVFADIDGDGWLDLLISTSGKGIVVFRNDQHGAFQNMTARAGTESPFGSMSMALADVDGNGTLDLYVANYRTEDYRDRLPIAVNYANGQPVIPAAYTGRLIFKDGSLTELGEPDILYLNDGTGRFTPVSWTGGRFLDESGRPLKSPVLDWGLSVTMRDLNGDGAPDIYVCNDYWTPDRVWLNDGKGTFRELPGSALRHTSENSMGVDLADIDRNGRFDLLVTDMLARDPRRRKRQEFAQTRTVALPGEQSSRVQTMANTLQYSRADGTYAEIARYSGIAFSDWSWQPIFLDVDLDGYEDVLIPSGHGKDIQDLDANFRIRSLQRPRPNTTDRAALQADMTQQIMAHARLYPDLRLPIMAFRNLGNLRFEDVTTRWGTARLGVHQGMALADLDGDGDLDFVVNNLNEPAAVYRNESSAPRLAVRLRGIPPNTEGTGALVKVKGGSLPEQMQEIVSGGRYLSGFEQLLVFAAPTNGPIRIEVHWRSGQVSRIPDASANRLYEINETGAERDSSTTPAAARPSLFSDVSERIGHIHKENVYDDFSRQLLIPKKLSQLGPGVAWFDLDRDGHEDLVIGNGGGGPLAVYRALGKGMFARDDELTSNTPARREQSGVVAFADANGSSILVGLSNYEDGRTNGLSVMELDCRRRSANTGIPTDGSTTGPLAMADYNGDGTLDLFVGGRALPGRYPEAARSFLYQRKGGNWVIDEKNSAQLRDVGLVSGAVWSDLDLDGFPELILVCEWGPIRIFRNVSGLLVERTAELGLGSYTGWWNGVTTGDLDGDGRPDIIASNWGLNSAYQVSPAQPLRLYYGDFGGGGRVELIEAEFDIQRKSFAPRLRIDLLASGIPELFKHFNSYRAFSEASMDQVLEILPVPARFVEARRFESMVFYNREDHFVAVELPREVQWAPAFGVNVADFNNDGAEDIFVSQNFFPLRPDMTRLDAGEGVILLGENSPAGKFRVLSATDSGIAIFGEQRGAATCDFDEDGRTDLVVTQNGGATRLFANRTPTPGIRVVLKGPPLNPAGIGASIRVRFGERWGPSREIHAGSGYWSQDSAVQVLGSPGVPSEIEVRWPGGRISRSAVSPDAREIRIDQEAGSAKNGF